MSLDVYLISKNPISKEKGSGIFIRENGATREISLEEWNEKFPGTEPVVINNTDDESNEVYSANITHNLTEMADAAGIYKALWRPEEIGITQAKQLIEPLTKGLKKLKKSPEKYKKFDSPNGWGLYIHFVPFVENYLKACIENPESYVEVWR
jgi:hypothetical protein